MALVLIKGRRTGLTTVASVLAGRASTVPLVPTQQAMVEDLIACGLAEAYRPHPALSPMTRPHYVPGAKVKVLAPEASRYHCQPGDTGTVANLCPAGGRHDKVPDDDLYFVDLDQPRTEKKRVYLTYRQIAAA